MSYACNFRNGEARRGLPFDEAWALFMAYRFTSNPCSLHVDPSERFAGTQEQASSAD